MPAKNPCQQVQYRSYIQPIQIYHYPHTLLPFLRFEAGLTKADHGYVKRLISSDPIAHITRAEGDETPNGFIEVAHLGPVFGAHKGASALGFRIPSEPGTSRVAHIEWLCFERGVQNLLGLTIAKPGSDAQVPLFDEVAELEKMENVKKGVVGNVHLEHKLWFESLKVADRPIVSLTITYKNKRRDMVRHWGEPKDSPALVRIEEEGKLSPIRAFDEEDDDEEEEMERVEKGKPRGTLKSIGTRKPVEDVQMQDSEKEDSDEDMEDLDVDTEMADLGLGEGVGPMTRDSVLLAAGKSRVDRQAAGEYV
jgi:hypothetical protein